MGSFDFFVAELVCPECGNRTPADATTNIQTKLRDAPGMLELGVGVELRTDPFRLEQAGYLELRTAVGPLRILQTWECPGCDRPFNWV